MVTTEILSEEDFAVAATWLSDPAINRWLGSFWRGRQFTPKSLAVVGMNPHNRLFLIRSDGKSVGLVGLGNIDPTDGSAVLWYLLGDSDWGSRGIVTEAVSQVVRVAFSDLGLRTISASTVDQNHASQRVLEKVGFQFVGTLRKGLRLDGEWVDRVVYDLLPEDVSLEFQG